MFGEGNGESEEDGEGFKSVEFSLAAVRECWILSCPLPLKIERGRMFQLPLKPKLLQHFVR